MSSVIHDVRNLVTQVHENGGKPRVHPNGFIQLDLETDGTRIASKRLHVWPDGDDIPKQSVVTTIHDHRFDMKSTVLKGALRQRVWRVRLDADTMTHEVYMAQYPADRKESVLTSTGVKANVEFDGLYSKWVVPLSAYTQPRYWFHDTTWEGLTATLMEKTGEDIDHNPRVLVPLGEKPDNTFVRSEVDEDLLWNYIARVWI